MRIRLIVFLVIIGVLIALSALGLWYRNVAIARISDFEGCAAAGYPIMESYPRQCRTPDGRLFVENVTLPAQP